MKIKIYDILTKTRIGKFFAENEITNTNIMSEEKEFNEEIDAASTPETQETNNEQESAENTVAEEQVSAEPTMEDKYAELNDKFVRLYSEFDNYRKRTNKEKLDLISTASAGVIKDLVSILDDFERAIANNEAAEDIQGVKEGFHLIFNKFKNTLETKGLKQMVAKGETFDSELHEAIANIPAPTEELKGKIVDDVEKGYYLHDKVIRYAKVVVGQ
jgi:molecular chaperone GrpE